MGQYSWFRLYHEARTDPKLASLTDAQFRQWFNLLCLASEQPTRGTIQFRSFRMLALQVTRCTEAEIQETLTILADLEMLEYSDHEVSFLQWEKRQFDKPSDTTEATRTRKRQQRERDKNDGHAMSRDVTLSHATEERREEGDTDTEREEKREDRSPEEEGETRAKNTTAAAPSLLKDVQEAANLYSRAMQRIVNQYAPAMRQCGTDIIIQAELWRDKYPNSGAASFEKWLRNIVDDDRRPKAQSPPNASNGHLPTRPVVQYALES